MIRDLPLQLPFWTCGKKITFRQCRLVRTKGLGLLSRGGDKQDMPTINGKVTAGSRSKSEGGDSMADEALAALGESMELVETEDDMSTDGLLLE